jgi:hypothetical protein
LRTLDERAAEIEAVMDAVGFTKPANLVVGSGTVFQNRGSAELRGVPGSWNLWRSIVKARNQVRPKRSLRPHPLPAEGPPCARPTEPLR